MQILFYLMGFLFFWGGGSICMYPHMLALCQRHHGDSDKINRRDNLLFF